MERSPLNTTVASGSSGRVGASPTRRAMCTPLAMKVSAGRLHASCTGPARRASAVKVWKGGASATGRPLALSGVERTSWSVSTTAWKV